MEQATVITGSVEAIMNHDLKTWTEYFQAIWDGSKTFELRKNDRGFLTGHNLTLREFDPLYETYSGRKIYARIGFMVQGEWGLDNDVCALSLLDIIRVVDPDETIQRQ